MLLHEVEQHFEKVDVNELKSIAKTVTPAAVKANPAVVLTKICTVYVKVKPFLVIVGQLFFVPKKWRDALSAFLLMNDAICAPNEPAPGPAQA